MWISLIGSSYRDLRNLCDIFQYCIFQWILWKYHIKHVRDFCVCVCWTCLFGEDLSRNIHPKTWPNFYTSKHLRETHVLEVRHVFQPIHPVPPKSLTTATAFIQKNALFRKSVPFTNGPNGMNSLKKLVVSFRVLGYPWWILAIRTIFAVVLMPQITMHRILGKSCFSILP